MGRVAGSLEHGLRRVSFGTTCARKDGIKRTPTHVEEPEFSFRMLWLKTNKGNA